MTLPVLFGRVPGELSDALDPERPWELLGEALDRLLESLPGEAIQIKLEPGARLLGDRISVGRGSRVEPGCTIEGPVFIGEDVVIRPGAYIRAGCWIGDGCVVGTNTEIKRSVLFPGAKAPHLAYVGDSVLGAGVNLGAGTVLSNFRHDGGEIVIPMGADRIETGRRKLGAILGEGVRTGCNSVASPGVVVGRDTEVYAGVVLRSGIYPDGSIIKLRQELDVVPRRP